MKRLFTVALTGLALLIPAAVAQAEPPDRLDSHRRAVLSADHACRTTFDIYGCWPHRTSVEHTRVTENSRVFIQDLYGGFGREEWHAMRFFIRRNLGDRTVTRVGSWYCTYTDRPNELPVLCFGGGTL
jgi:hypothetical protein